MRDLTSRLVLTNAGTSALVRGAPPVQNGFHQVLVPPDPEEGHVALHSGEGPTEILFTSAIGDKPLLAGLHDLNPGTGQNRIRLSMAWSAEDLGLQDSGKPPSSFWPLPGWDYAPVEESPSFPAFMDETTGGSWRAGPWFKPGEDFPMIPEASPSLVPVVRRLGLRFGIFATGPVRSREKVVRLRYYLEGEIWNPYNRPMLLHTGSGRRALFRVIFWNLPEVRIHNQSMGMSTGWISLDEAENASSGNRGLRGWIRTQGILESASTLAFEEPDTNAQPEGLARTLHPAFLAGPADRIMIEFRQPPGGVYAACLPIEDDEPMEAALEGHGWHRIEGFSAEWPILRFDRADGGDRPFLLEDGSLSFRRENTHLWLDLRQSPDLVSQGIDPRRRHVNYLEAVPDAAGNWHTGARLLQLKLHNQLEETEFTDPDNGINPPVVPLFSWPQSEPLNLREAMDLPDWQVGFRLGTAGAMKMNAQLEESGLWTVQQDNLPGYELIDAEGDPHRFNRAFHVNSLSPEAWFDQFLLGSETDPANPLMRRFPVYPVVDDLDHSHFQSWSIATLEKAARDLVQQIRQAPSSSVADFFDRGLLGNSIPREGLDADLHRLMPLRGWLSGGALPRSHGPAWVLHLAVRGILDHRTIRKSARLWLLEVHPQGESPRFEVIRFESTRPESHLTFIQQQ